MTLKFVYLGTSTLEEYSRTYRWAEDFLYCGLVGWLVYGISNLIGLFNTKVNLFATICFQVMNIIVLNNNLLMYGSKLTFYAERKFSI